MKVRNLILIFWICILAGLCVRLGVICYNGYGPHYEHPLGMDEANYKELVFNILRFNIFGAWSEGFWAQSTRSPGYPLVLASFFRLFSSSWAPQIMNLLLECLNILLVFLIANKLYGRTAGMISSCIYSIYGPVINFVPFVTPEILSISVILAFVYSFLMLKDFYKFAIVPSVLIYAFLIHTRPVFLLCLPFLVFLFYMRCSGRKLLKSFIPVAVILVLCLPWGIRNYKVHGTVMPVCSIAGWHIVTAAKYGDDLSTDSISNYLYRPDHKDFTEGDFFRESSAMFRDGLMNSPLRFAAMGILRILKMWGIPDFYYRVFLPKAYIVPIYITDRIFVPVPDFEGIFYLLSFLLIFLILKKGLKSGRDFFFPWYRSSREIVLFLIVYAALHILGIPLIQYRLVVEPLVIILAVGLLLSFFNLPDNPLSFKNEKYLPIAIMIFFAVLAAFPLLFRTECQTVKYPVQSSDYPGFKKLREMQWQALGNVPENTKSSIFGIVRYGRPDLKFMPGKNVAERDSGSAVGRLYINSLSEKYPAASGDVKLNFKAGNCPSDNSVINVEGSVSTGAYKDLIIDVEKWEYIVR